MPISEKTIDIISAGELLADFISVEFAERMDQVENFRRLMGGSPANLCMNMARLGHNALLAATVGKDDLGKYLVQFVEKAGVDTQLVRKVQGPTTLILVTRSMEAANFEPYRTADIKISEAQFPSELLKKTKLFHTTCFALSKQPARKNIMAAARQVHLAGGQISIDANYASKIWPRQKEAQAIVAEYCKMGALVKVSEVDWQRLYGSVLIKPEEAAQHFLALGAREVCVTLGGDGSYAANKAEQLYLSALPVKVVDTTGAGDAYWSGYLSAWLKGKTLKQRLEAGRQVATLKLQQFGPFTHNIELKEPI